MSIGGSFRGVIIGLLLIAGSVYLLWTNEGRAVHVAKALEEGAGSVKSISADKVDPANEGKLVHLSGEVKTKDTLCDDEFNIKVNALKLIREVEFYQWKEKSTGKGNSASDYSYKKEWVNAAIPSDKFKVPEDHVNKTPYPYAAYTKLAKNVSFGGFAFTEELLGYLTTSEKLQLAEIDSNRTKNTLLNAGYFYIGSRNILNPEIGDVRITYKAVYPMKASVVARQTANTFEEYIASNDETVLLVKEGVSSADNMFKVAVESNKFKTWMLRWLGFFMLFFGIRAIFKPIVALGNMIPLVGNLISMGVGIVSFALAVPVTAIVISLAWFAYRPLLSGIIIGCGLLIYFYYRNKGKKRAGAINNLKTNADNTSATLNAGNSKIGESK